ncbi:hypothetical protein AB0G32_07515 [Streptomyces sp. NPDC023723]|uniref:hypothetical protein n=1 Tax=Streptomyces sp. NPDC023723 TaxID=3154323 RepID=UPI0033D077B1
MSGGGYQVDPEALEQITRGIEAALAELKELGFDIEAGLGRGFDDLELTGLEVGDAALRQVFADFCERWGWGVRSLIGDANGFAERLRLNAGLYHEQEQYVSDTLKGVWTAAAGNPYLTEQQVEQRSWSDTLKDNSLAHVTDPDYSAESDLAGYEAARQAWAQAGQDVESSPVTLDAPFDPRTDWQWGGGPSGEGEATR